MPQLLLILLLALPFLEIFALIKLGGLIGFFPTLLIIIGTAIFGIMHIRQQGVGLINELQVGNKNVLYGTQAIFSEGISINVLSCLILGTPINNDPLLTQLIGRIIRKEKNIYSKSCCY